MVGILMVAGGPHGVALLSVALRLYHSVGGASKNLRYCSGEP